MQVTNDADEFARRIAAAGYSTDPRPYNPDQGTGPEGFKQRVMGCRSVLANFDLRIEDHPPEQPGPGARERR